MIPHSAAFARAATGPHAVICRVDVLSPTGTVLENAIPVADGKLTCSASADIRRQSDQMTLDPGGPLGALPQLLTPSGTELRLWRGIGWPLRAPELLCLATLGIETVSVDQGTGLVQVSSYDRLKRVARARFPFDRVAPSLSVLNNIRILWREAVPQAPDVVVDPDVVDVQLPTLPTWSKTDGRLGAIKDMCAALAAEPVVEPMGNLRIRLIPDPQGAPTTPTFTPANVLSAQVSQSRADVYNGIVCESESGTGTPIKSDLIKDDNPLSPTKWDPNGFGEVVGFVSSAYVKSVDQANFAAQGNLNRTLGLRATVQFDSMPNVALSEGDIAPVRLPGSVDQHVLDTVTLGLGATDVVSAQTRVATSQDVS